MFNYVVKRAFYVHCMTQQFPTIALLIQYWVETALLAVKKLKIETINYNT